MTAYVYSVIWALRSRELMGREAPVLCCAILLKNTSGCMLCFTFDIVHKHDLFVFNTNMSKLSYF